MPLPSFPITNTSNKVAVFDNNFNQLFPEAKIIKINVKEDITLMDHPLETGETLTDHAIIEPIEIEMDILIRDPNYINTYNIVKKLATEFTELTVQTNTGTYQNQVISSMPHIESNEIYDGTIINLKFKQALFITPQYGTVPISPKNQNNNSTTDRGTQNGSSGTPQLESEWHKQNRLARG